MRHRVTLFTALVSLVIAAEALAASGPPPFISGEPVPVIVTNPSTAPASTIVTNPATAPALTSSIDDPGRIAYQSTQSVVVPFNFCGDVDKFTCFLQFPAVPANHRLVVQNISGEFTYSGPPKSIRATLTHGGSGFQNGIVAFLAPSAVDGQSLFSQPALLYIDAGEIPVISFFVNGATLDATTQTVTLTGYMLDCTVNQCASVAH